MKRGDVVIVSAQSDYGKPRPAVVIQADLLNEHADSVIVCLMTGTASSASMVRMPVAPSPGNGLQQVTYLMTEKLMTFPKSKISKITGELEEEIMFRLDRILAFVLGLAE